MGPGCAWIGSCKQEACKKHWGISLYTEDLIQLVLLLEPCTVYAVIFAGVLFSRISRVRHRENFHFSLCAIYSNGHITKIAKLSPREVPDLVQNRGKLYTRNI